MSEIAIRVEGLSKRYLIASPGQRARYKTLQGELLALPHRLLARARGGQPAREAFWALQDVSFEVKQGEVLGVIGRNGAGKSTLLKILSRITEPTSGQATLYGRVGSLLEVGTGFHPELTGRENVFLSGAVLGMLRREVQRKFDEIVAFADIEKFIDTPAKHYSSGMYMRLAFSVAAHLEPEILLVDEVLAVGDAEFQRKCLGKMSEVAQAGRTVLFVSHNLAAVQSMCQRAVLIEAGRLAATGTPEVVVSKYVAQTATTRGAISWRDQANAPGCASLQLVAARLCSDEGQTKTEFDLTEPVYVEVEFEVIEAGTTAGVTVLLYNQENVLVLSSISSHSAWHGRRLPAGVYRSTCHVPGNFLNAGQHAIGLILWKNSFDLSTQLDQVLWFDAIDSGKARFGYYRDWLGVVRPRLDWTLEPAGTN